MKQREMCGGNKRFGVMRGGKTWLLAFALSCHFALIQPEKPSLQRPVRLFAEAKSSVPMQGKKAQHGMEPGVGLDAMRTGHMPALLCERVTGIDGKWGLLCKPLPASNTTGMNETEIQNSQRIARELAEQAHMLNAPNKATPVMHRIPAVYHWQDSTSFTYIQHKKHYYNVQYADSSALKIETGLDVCELGPFRFYTRFGLITEAVSGRPGADLQGADGILGFGYTDLPRSASLMRTMTRRTRPNWGLVQPNSMSLMANNSFAVLSSVTQGELQLGGFDPAAVDGEVSWVPMVNLTGYGVNITSVTYGGKELLQLGERGQHAGGTMGIFDTGSTCLNLPRGLFDGYYKSSLFDNFAALASTNPTLPIIITLNGRVKLEIPQSSWSEPWACTYPFTHSNVVLFGHHIFRAYMVIHDMNPPFYHMGFAKIAPSYVFGGASSVLVNSKGQRPSTPREEGEASSLALVAKVPLSLEQRVHLFISLSLGTPPQTFRCVFDTGSVLLAVFSGNVSTDMVAKKTPEKVMHVEEPAPPRTFIHSAKYYPSKHPRPAAHRTNTLTAPLPPPPTHAHTHTSIAEKNAAEEAEESKITQEHRTKEEEEEREADRIIAEDNAAEKAAADKASEAGSSTIEHIALYGSGSFFAFIACMCVSNIAFRRLSRKRAS